MTEFKSQPKEFKKIVMLGTGNILIDVPGRSDNHTVVIEYPKRVSKWKTETWYWPVCDYEICESYIVLNRMYTGHQREWDNLVFDSFNVEIDENFGHNIEKVFEKHSWIKSVFLRETVNNHFSRVWPAGLLNIKGVIIMARLIGNARDYKYDSFEDPADVPIDTCMGKNIIKDFLYKINQQKYPDFYRITVAGPEGPFKTDKWDAKHFDFNRLLENENVSEQERTEFVIKNWAAKLVNSQIMWMGESKRDAKNRIKNLAWETIDRTRLSFGDKEKEKDVLTKYRIY